jgi:hypothetical protein
MKTLRYSFNATIQKHAQRNNQMVVLTPTVRELKKQFPELFELWEDNKLRLLGFREGDIDVIHELFGRNFLHTGIIVLLAFTHGDCYPSSTIEEILNLTKDSVSKALPELIQRNIVYSEKFGHPVSGLPFYYADKGLLLALVREFKLEAAKRRVKKTQQGEETLLVFVSSVMNKEVEDMGAERQMARVGIEDVGFTRSWLFEDTPASSEPLPKHFLTMVKRSDFFVLILGKHITNNVKQEYQTAKKSGIKCLVFLKAESKRSEETMRFIERIRVKYKEFLNPNELRTQVSASLIDEILRIARRRART